MSSLQRFYSWLRAKWAAPKNPTPTGYRSLPEGRAPSPRALKLPQKEPWCTPLPAPKYKVYEVRLNSMLQADPNSYTFKSFLEAVKRVGVPKGHA